jgi:hypothetical protein
LANIEELLSNGVPDLDMEHYREFNSLSGVSAIVHCEKNPDGDMCASINASYIEITRRRGV